jgi:RNA recognition motif-containing protein
MGKKLFVGNLAFSTSGADLEALFASAGTVESATVINDRDTGRSRGFGFVEMSSATEASKAIAELNGKDVGGRAINVSEAKEQSRPGGGGGGGGGRRNSSGYGGRSRY